MMQNRNSTNEEVLPQNGWEAAEDDYGSTEDHSQRLQRGMYQLLPPAFAIHHRLNQDQAPAAAIRNRDGSQHDDTITFPSILNQRFFPTFAQYGTFPSNTRIRYNNFAPHERYDRSNFDEYRLRSPLDWNLQTLQRENSLHDMLHSNYDYSRLDWQPMGDAMTMGVNNHLSHDMQLSGNEIIAGQISENTSVSVSLMACPWSTTSAGAFGAIASSATEQKSKKARKKPKDKPKRPLSAYNIFFKEERQRILEDIPESKPSAIANPRKRKKSPHGKIGFETLAKVIGRRWQDLAPDQVERYKQLAKEDMQRYKIEMETYLSKVDRDDCNDEVSGKLEISDATQLKSTEDDSD